MSKMCYLSGAMGYYIGDGNDYPKKWRADSETYLKENSFGNFKVFNPTLFYNYNNSGYNTEKEIVRFELKRLKESDVVLVNLKDVEKSVGTIQEIFLAHILHIPIVGFLTSYSDYTNDELERLIHPWIVYEIDRIETGTNAMRNAIDYIIQYYGEG